MGKLLVWPGGTGWLRKRNEISYDALMIECECDSQSRVEATVLGGTRLVEGGLSNTVVLLLELEDHIVTLLGVLRVLVNNGQIHRRRTILTIAGGV